MRKKLRGAADAEARSDVLTELRVARLLLEDRRIEVAFEAYGARAGGPDFTVFHRSHRAFNLEVTRLRHAERAVSLGGALLTKVRQLPSGVPNAVLFATGDVEVGAAQVDSVARELRVRADAREDAFFGRRGFATVRDFYDRYLRLGGVLLWRGEVSGRRTELWLNRSARLTLPERAIRACVAALDG